MRYNETQKGPNKIVLETPETDSVKFFTSVFRDLDKRAIPVEAPVLLLVGGRDWRSLAIRSAQAFMRMDQQPSFWSHAAVILERNLGKPEASLGTEASFVPEDPDLHVPERNGVTPFHLKRYCDLDAYPELAVIAFRQPTRKGQVEWSPEAGVSAALSPNRERVRFPLWDHLGAWGRFLHDPMGAPNPLSQNIPLPSASYCAYVFEAAGLHLTPNATAPQTCPELFWATALFWAEGLSAEGVETLIYRRTWERYTFAREALSPKIELGGRRKRAR
jgi:hypothetical protein